MFDLKLFLGFAPDDLFESELKKANPHLISLFIGKEDYLQVLEQGGCRYLGKPLYGCPSVDQISDLEKHLLSLLQRLTPHYPFDHNPPLLITYGT